MATSKKKKAASKKKASAPKKNASVKKATKKAAKKAAKKIPAKKKAAAKKPAVKKQSQKNIKASGKKPAAAKTKKTRSKSMQDVMAKADSITHGQDMHLIPVTGEINPAGAHDSKEHEKAFRHRNQTLMQQENLRAKAALATRKGSKPVYRNFKKS